jgi:hypothetical protein
MLDAKLLVVTQIGIVKETNINSKMKNHLIIIVLLLAGLNGFGQKKTDSLSFTLKVIVNDIETTKSLDKCEVKVIGTDGSSQELTTFSSGETGSFKLKANTSYSIVIYKDKYITGKGKETTVGATRSKTFIHEYNIQPFIICTVHLVEQYYKHNATVPYKSGPTWDGKYDTTPAEFYYDVMTENPTLIMQITGYQDDSEEDNISIKRAKEYVQQLVKLGIDEGRLIAHDGGVKVYKEFIGRQSIEKEIVEENRMIYFRIVSDDYKKE